MMLVHDEEVGMCKTQNAAEEFELSNCGHTHTHIIIIIIIIIFSCFCASTTTFNSRWYIQILLYSVYSGSSMYIQISLNFGKYIVPHFK